MPELWTRMRLTTAFYKRENLNIRDELLKCVFPLVMENRLDSVDISVTVGPVPELAHSNALRNRSHRPIETLENRGAGSDNDYLASLDATFWRKFKFARQTLRTNVRASWPRNNPDY